MNAAAIQTESPAGCTVAAGPAVTSRTEPTSPVRARRTDPTTSHEAAANAACFVGTHYERILAALEMLGSGTPKEIGKECGLTVVQVDRRLVELQREGRALVLHMPNNKPVTRDGFRVWCGV